MKPVKWVLELGNFRVGNTNRLQDLKLSGPNTFACLGGSLGILGLNFGARTFVLRTNVRARAHSFILSRFYFSLESLGCSMNRHTSAMESEWEQYILTELFLKSDLKLALIH